MKKCAFICAAAAVCCVFFGSCSKADSGDSYTYRTAVDSLPSAWNTHTYQSNSATNILGYTEDNLYSFDYNNDKSGYKIAPAMAADMPEDVTAQYIGTQWDITSGETWRAVRVNLRDDLRFDNGDDITAEDFVKSVQLLLNPDAANYRADSLYGGSFSIVGAEKYAKAGKYSYTAAISADYSADEYFSMDGLTEVNGTLKLGENDVVLNINDGANFGSPLTDLYGSLPDIEGFEQLLNSADDSGYVRLTREYVTVLQNITAALHGYESVAAYAAECALNGAYVGVNGDINYAYAEWQEMCFFGKEWDGGVDFSTVGVLASGDYALDFILEKPLSGFYLNYALNSSMFLVHTDTYEQCASTSQGAYSNDYATSADKYVGFGPYRLTTFVADSVATFEKNEYWYGYNDGADDGLYMTTGITLRQVSDAGTRLGMFLSGQLDEYSLIATDMQDYASSDYVYYTEGESTWCITLNPDMDGLTAAQSTATPSVSGKTVNKTVLTLNSFRRALSLSVDREAYELALDPTGSVAKALLGNMIVSDPENGVTYRSTDEAKGVIVGFWGLADEIGDGREYADEDAAIAAVTGYDLAAAKKYFEEAYYEAVALKLLDETTDWEVQIVIGQPGSGGSEYYNNGYEFLKKAWTATALGTPFEGRLYFSQSQPLGSTDFASALKNNTVDVLFGVGWTGSALDPYSLMEAYVSPTYRYDSGWDTAEEFIEITLDGRTLSASVYDWGYSALQGNDITARDIASGESVTVNAGTSADGKLRLKILAAVEEAVLNRHDMIPVGTQSRANLKSMRINYGSENYVYGIGRGGVKYMTYSMPDGEWDRYVKNQGGTLNYR